MSEQRWMYELLSEEFGPVSTEELAELKSSGTLSDADRVRLQESSNWTTVSDALSEAVADEATAISDLSELSFSFESGDSSSSDGGLDIDSFNLQGDSDSPQPESHLSAEPEPQDEELPAADYFVQSLGQELGPMPLEEMVMMAEAGTLSAGDRVRTNETGWADTDSIPELAAIFMNIVGNEDVSSAPTSTTPPVEAAESPDSSSPKAATVQESPSPKSGSSGKGKGGKGRRKKKRRQEDEKLKEIFSEVFTEDGKLREDLANKTPEPAATPQPSPAVPADSAGTGVGAASIGAGAQGGLVDAASPPMGSPAGGGYSPPATPPTPPSRPAFSPKRRRRQNPVEVCSCRAPRYWASQEVPWQSS